MKAALRVAAAAYILYLIVAVWLHPAFIYPFADTPYEGEGFTLTALGPNGTQAYVADGDPGAPTVLYFMGNIGTLASFDAILQMHRDRGRRVVALAYPGGGGIPGQASEIGLKALALDAYDAAAGQGPVVVHGYSLGTGLALAVAAEREVDAVILDAPFARLCEVMARQALIPACALPGIQTWDSESLAPRVTAPVLIRHGAEDTLIPPAQSLRLATSLQAEGVTVERDVIAEADHLTVVSGPDYAARIDGFLGETLR